MKQSAKFKTGQRVSIYNSPGPQQIYEVDEVAGPGQLGRTVHFFRLHYGGLVDNTLKLWNLTTGTELTTLTGHTAYINASAITWDGKRAISAALRQPAKSLG